MQVDRHSSPLEPLSNSFSRTAFELTASGSYWDLYLPKGDFANQKNGKDSSIAWAETAQGLSASNSTLHLALLALSVTSAARSNNDAQMMVQGNKLYGEALQRLNRSLQIRTAAQQDSVIPTCMFLSLYEVSTPTS